MWTDHLASSWTSPKDLLLLKAKFESKEQKPWNKVLDQDVFTKTNNLKYQLANINFSLLKNFTFHVQSSSWVIGDLGDNHYQLVIRQSFVKFIKPWKINTSPIFLFFQVSFEILSLELKIIVYPDLDNVFSYKSYSSTLVMLQLHISRIFCLQYICLIFSILKIIFNMVFDKKYVSLCSSVCL